MRVGVIFLVLALAVRCFAAPGAVAQAEAGGVWLGTASESGHAWVLLDAPAAADAEDDPAWQLVHVPPRAGPGSPGAEAGTARFARTIHVRPEFYSASGDRLVMVFPPGDGGERRVLTIRARPTVAEGVWYFEPSSRLGTLPALPAGLDVVGLRHRDGEPEALLAGGGSRVLTGKGWTEAAPVDGGGGAAGAGRVVFGGGPVAVGGTGLTVLSRGGEVVAVDVAGDTVAAIPVSGAGEAGSAGAALVAVVPIEAPRPRLLLLTSRTMEAAAPAYRATEVSLDTGRLWYDGPVRGVSPITVQDFRLLVAALVGILVVSLVVIIRPADDEGVLSLPEGVGLAEPGRRFLATALDLVLVTWLVSRLTSGSIAGVVSPATWFSTGPDFGFLYATLLIGLAYGTVFEWLVGRTPGKWLVGCRVVRVQGRDGSLRGVGLVGCVTRNAMKWLVPPVAMLPLLNHSARHRGDLMAGAAVVLDEVDEAEGGPPDSGS